MRGNRLFKFIDRCIGIPILFLASLTQKREDDSSAFPPRNILVIKFTALGDAILLIPSLRALRKKYPQAKIIFLGTDLTIPFLRQFPEYVDEIVTLDIGRMVRRPAYFFSLIRQLRSLELDIAIDFEQWLRVSALLVVFSGAKIKIGFRSKGQHKHFAFTRVVDRDIARHVAENFLRLVELAGASGDNPITEAKINEESLVRAQGFLIKHGWKKGKPIIIIHPGCGAHGFPREWRPERYGELITRLSTSHPALVLVTGTVSELPAMEAVARSTQVPVARYEISTLEDFIALISLSSLFVSSNNGAMHLAAALKLPQIALHGPTNAVQWGPLNPKAVVIKSSCPSCPCLDLGFEYHRTDGFCMDQIGVAEVGHAANGLLGSVSA